MNMRDKVAHYSVLLSIIFGFNGSVASATDAEEAFSRLRSKVHQLKSIESESVQSRIERAKPNITACPVEFTIGMKVRVTVDGIEYAYTTKRTSTDLKKYCFIIAEPLGRALTVEEAQDFSAALMMPSISQIPIKSITMEKREQRVQQGERHFSDLVAVVNSGIAKTIAPDVAERAGIRDFGDLATITDCSTTPVDELEKRAMRESASETGQTIFNDFYRWHDLVRTGPRCIYVTSPFQRGLTAAEGRTLLQASRLDLGVTEEIQSESQEPVDSDIEEVHKIEGDREVGVKNGPQPMAAVRLNDFAYPYNTVGALYNATFNRWASAVQIGAYTYATAAHNLLGPENQVDDWELRPAFNMGPTSPHVRFEAVIGPGYTFVENEIRGRDLAILLAGTRNNRLPATLLRIQSWKDQGGGTLLCAPSLEHQDAMWYDVSESWYNPTGPNGQNNCFRDGPNRAIVHYPPELATTVELRDKNIKPFISRDVGLFGSTQQGTHRELIYNTADQQPVLGMTNAYVYRGSSGGGLFAQPLYGARSQSVLMGIVIVQAGTGGYAVGQIDNNSSFWQQYKDWQPNPNITISSPAENGIYDRASVPNLVGTGPQASQFRWTSNIDGLLGTGANVAVAGRLSPGAHTITVTIGSTQIAGTSDPAYRTLHITVTGSSSPSINVTPSMVLIPATATTGPFTFTWNVPGYTSLDLRARINGSDWGAAVPITGSGINGNNIPLYDTWVYGFFPRGSMSLLGSFSVVGVEAPPPTFTMSPTQVLVGPTMTVGPYAFSWNAPGYQELDLYGQVNNGDWLPAPGIPGSGNNGNNIAASVTHRYRFYPHGDNQHLLGELSVTGVPRVAPTFSISPSVVIVPPGQSSGPFTYSWSAPGYASLDLWGRINGGNWLPGPNVNATDSSGDIIPLGSTYEFRFYPPGQSTNPVGYLSVTARR